MNVALGFLVGLAIGFVLGAFGAVWAYEEPSRHSANNATHARAKEAAV